MALPAARSRAALALAALLWLASLPRAGAPPPACADPAEWAAEAGHSREVACGESARGRPPLRGPALLLFGRPLDLNAADAAALETLPGVGPVRAAAIVRERGRRRFASVAELERVPGIGPRTLARLGDRIAVEAARENR